MAKNIERTVCRNCGKEIRADTKYCPFCSVENIDVRNDEADIHRPNKIHTVPVPETVPINKEETQTVSKENTDTESSPKEENPNHYETPKETENRKHREKSAKKQKYKSSQKSNCTISFAGCMDALFFVILVMVVGIGVFCIINPETRNLVVQTVEEVSYELQQ